MAVGRFTGAQKSRTLGERFGAALQADVADTSGKHHGRQLQRVGTAIGTQHRGEGEGVFRREAIKPGGEVEFHT